MSHSPDNPKIDPAAETTPSIRMELRCRKCGRTVPRPGDALRKMAGGSWPECCGHIMVPKPMTLPDLELPPELRSEGRRKPRTGTQVEVRRGLMGIGFDVASGLLNLSAAGACVRLMAPVKLLDRVHVTLRRPQGVSRPHRLEAQVRWVHDEGGSNFVAGVRFRHLLSAGDLAAMAEGKVG